MCFFSSILKGIKRFYFFLISPSLKKIWLLELCNTLIVFTILKKLVRWQSSPNHDISANDNVIKACIETPKSQRRCVTESRKFGQETYHWYEEMYTLILYSWRDNVLHSDIADFNRNSSRVSYDLMFQDHSIKTVYLIRNMTNIFIICILRGFFHINKLYFLSQPSPFAKSNWK